MDNLKNFIITIDEGHGGNDPGAVDLKDDTTGDFVATLEKVLNKKVGDKVVQKLRDLQATVISTRENDEFVSLGERCRLANNAHSHLFVSIHFNAGFSSAHGIETFIYRDSTNPVTKKLGENLQTNLIKATGLYDRKLQTSGFYVLKYTQMPAALIELGFVTNSKEEQLINTDQYQEKVAYAIVEAIKETLSK